MQKNTINRYIIGKNIANRLYFKHKTQKWLAIECGVTPSHINQIIKGTIGPSLQLLISIADLLDTSIDDLLKENSN